MASKKHCKLGDENCVEKVWGTAAPIAGMDKDKYRKDVYGNIIYKQSFGKNTMMGWAIDHIKPVNRGGSDDIVNLQALSTNKTELLGDTLKKKDRHSKSNRPIKK